MIGIYLHLMRAPAVFTALSNILAAHLILTQGAVIWSGLLLLLTATAALYSGGMVLNDWFDYEVDLREHPTRPLPSGKIPPRAALVFGALLLAAGIGFAALAGSRSFWLALGIVTLVLLYNGLLKRTVSGPLAMAGCRYFNWLLGFSLLPLTERALLLPIPVFLYIAALTLLSREEESAKNRSTVICVVTGILLAGLSIISIGVPEARTLGWQTLPVLFGIGFLCQRLWLTYRDFSPQRVQADMKLLILAVIPLDAILVLTFGPAWGAVTVLALLLPGKLLARMMPIT
jgi:4-hydroxybenzoate polyprenyltransferase